MPQPPVLSDDARRAALAKAAEARRVRAEIRTRLKSGAIGLPALLEQVDDDLIGKMKVLSVVESMPGVGKVKSRRIMEQCGISESRRLQGLGRNQRDRLLNALS